MQSFIRYFAGVGYLLGLYDAYDSMYQEGELGFDLNDLEDLRDLK
ncbi:hypothetical protein [Enterococcus cecorum]|nr:hypothetical protein [Enterococcus cecorum]